MSTILMILLTFFHDYYILFNYFTCIWKYESTCLSNYKAIVGKLFDVNDAMLWYF